jgi:hypothetical protein
MSLFEDPPITSFVISERLFPRFTKRINLVSIPDPVPSPLSKRAPKLLRYPETTEEKFTS